MNESNKPQKMEWGDDIIDVFHYGAMNGQSPTYIAYRAGFKGELRQRFLQDITNPKTQLGSEWRKARDILNEDLDSTIHFLQIQGNTDAMEVAIKRETIEYIKRLREELFGL